MFIRLRRFVICFVLVGATLALGTMPHFWGVKSAPDVPYGVFVMPGTDDIGTQDMAYNLDFLRQIWRETVPHPYRLQDQERMARNWFPRMVTGLPHGYSPVAAMMALPLLLMKPGWAYFFVTFLNGILLILLTCLYLLPRMENSVQVGALLASLCGYVPIDLFFMGQTSILTTSLLALGFVILSNRSKSTLSTSTRASFSRQDLVLGGLFYMLLAKPSVALILVAMLMAERAWAALMVTGIALAITWLVLASHYGGFLSGLEDYAWLLNHYCQADMTPYMWGNMRPSICTNFTTFGTVLYPVHGETIFQVSRVLFEGLVVVLCLVRWKRWISLTTQFHGLLWSFLLFSPYLLVTEDFAVTLLTTGLFFRPGAGAPLKILLVLLLVNSCIGRWTILPLFFPIKLALAGWWMIDLIIFQPRMKKEPVDPSSEMPISATV